MLRGRDILDKKASSSKRLKESVSEEGSSSIKPRLSVNSKGEKILVFDDPLYSKEKRSIINYSEFTGKWDFEIIDDADSSDPEKCSVKLIPKKEFSEITLTFKSMKDRVEFMSSIYSDNELKQRGRGMNLEHMANHDVLNKKSNPFGISLTGLGMFRLLSKLMLY